MGSACGGHAGCWGGPLSAVCCRARGAIRALSRRDLIAHGCAFDTDDGYDLHREGGYSARRILHSKDNGGRIIRALLEAVEEHPKITVLENRMVVDLITEVASHAERGLLRLRTGPRALR